MRVTFCRRQVICRILDWKGHKRIDPLEELRYHRNHIRRMERGPDAEVFMEKGDVR